MAPVNSVHAALYQSICRNAHAEQWSGVAGYRPAEPERGVITRLGARIAKASAAFDDHPGNLRRADGVRTVTVDPVFNFIAGRDRAVVRTEVNAVPGGSWFAKWASSHGGNPHRWSDRKAIHCQYSVP